MSIVITRVDFNYVEDFTKQGMLQVVESVSVKFNIVRGQKVVESKVEFWASEVDYENLASMREKIKEVINNS